MTVILSAVMSENKVKLMSFLGLDFTWFSVGTFLIMVINLYGTVLNSHQKKTGFFIWGFCNILWSCINFYKGIFWQGVQNIIFLGLNVYGYLCWKYTTEVVDKKIKKYFKPCKCCHRGGMNG